MSLSFQPDTRRYAYLDIVFESLQKLVFFGFRILSSKDNTLLQELRHPNILQFLGSIVHGEEMILITEYLPKVFHFFLLEEFSLLGLFFFHILQLRNGNLG